MLKILLNILFTLVLLVETVGFTVSKHYCGGKIVSIALDSTAKSCCGEREMANCCHNEVEHFQLEENLNLPVLFEFDFHKVEVFLLPIFHVIEQIKILTFAKDITFSEGPPLYSYPGNDVLALIQVFII